jgi:hypothetical protein
MRRIMIVLAALCAAALPLRGDDVVARIREEEQAHSQILRTMHALSDLYGPRLTGSPNQKAAAEWALRQMRDWGMQNAHLEPWDFGHAGWTNERASGAIVAPVRQELALEAVAWTPSTRGTITAQAVVIDVPDTPTKEELARALAAVHVRGRIAMIGNGAPAPIDLDPILHRLDDKLLTDILQPNRPPQPETPPDGKLTNSEKNRQIDAYLRAAGALLRVNDARRAHGLIRAAANDTFEPRNALPSVILRNEDYGRIARIAADGTPVTLQFDVRNRLWPEGRASYNTIAEIPGGDRRDEVVILGAHLDSWHVATGATDDAIGCAIMMEAARILRALAIQPRRTIRVALWTGEEQGLYGSQDYVARHYGTAEDPLPDFSKLAAYINLDSGTGRIRAANVFGPPEAAAILRDALAPLHDLGFAGTVAHKIRKLRSTDATTFSRAGLPAIGLTQDPIEYGASWHTSVDTYERIDEGEAKDAAIVVATLAYELATRDEPLPRFPRGEMPPAQGPPPAARQRGGGARVR